MPNDPRIQPKQPRAVELLALPRVQILDVAGPLQVFATANHIAGGDSPAYVTRVVPQEGVALLAHTLVRGMACPSTAPVEAARRDASGRRNRDLATAVVLWAFLRARQLKPERIEQMTALKAIIAAAMSLLLITAPALAQFVPAAEWPRTTPQAAGWSPDLLAEAHGYAQRIGTASLLVVQHGQIIDSLGDITQRLELHSMRKSLLSALIGIAVAERRISLDATLGHLGIDDVPPVLTPQEKQATVADLLAARSGVYHVALYETEGERRNRPPRGSHTHGTFWYYNNWDFNALGAIYERAEGQSVFAGFLTHIAQPIGMQDYHPADGRYVTGPESSIPAYPFHMSARDLARFGLLYLHGGQWAGRQVVPAAWVADSTKPRSITTIGSGYAYLWWTGWAGAGVPVMGLPPGAFWADGAEGQFVVIDPTDDLVVVHQTADEPVGRREFGHLMWLIRRAAHAADPGPDPALRDRR